MQLPKSAPGEMLWRQVEDDYPGGIAQVDVESVISSHPVKRYTVLPGAAGLAELVDSGALEIIGTSHGLRLRAGDFKPRIWADKFLVMKKFRMPAGARGKFTLVRNIPVPDGDLSQVCIDSDSDAMPTSSTRQGRC